MKIVAVICLCLVFASVAHAAATPALAASTPLEHGYSSLYNMVIAKKATGTVVVQYKSF